MKFYFFIQSNLIFLIPKDTKNPLVKKFKNKKIINYNYTKTKYYKKNCEKEIGIEKIVFIKKEKNTDVLFVFKSKKEFFIKGR